MFNGYHEAPLMSYNEFDPERQNKQENVQKWSCGNDNNAQSSQPHTNRQGDYWPSKSNFIGITNVTHGTPKCNCSGCYSSENQSYQGDTTRHRPWLPRTFPVPLNGSNESCKLPGYQWENIGLANQGSCFLESNVAPLQYVQDNGTKHPYYRHYQNPRIPEPNQPTVITSVKNSDFSKKDVLLKQKENVSGNGQEMSLLVQNSTRLPVFCSPAYNLSRNLDKSVDGRFTSNFCDSNDKYSNVDPYRHPPNLTSYSDVPRLPSTEPYTKVVPSNLNQNRVPSTGQRKDVPQADEGAFSTKICSEKNGRIIYPKEGNGLESYHPGQLDFKNSPMHINYLNAEKSRTDAQKFYESHKHSDYFARIGLDVIKRNKIEGKKNCSVNQMNQTKVHEPCGTMAKAYIPNMPKYLELGNTNSGSCGMFYPKEGDKLPKPEKFDHMQETPGFFQQSEDIKNENANIHARLPRSALIFNDPRDPRFNDRPQNSFPYPNNLTYRNYVRPEYSCQRYNAQEFSHPPHGEVECQRNDLGHHKTMQQNYNAVDQFMFHPSNAVFFDSNYQHSENVGKVIPQQYYAGKDQTPPGLMKLYSQVSVPSQPERKTTNLETIRREEVNKNGSSKISPLRLLRKKKFANQANEVSAEAPTPPANTTPALDVRKFWSTWADEEEENVAPPQMVVLDCQNIDSEQAKLLHIHGNDPVRAVVLETLKDPDCDSSDQSIQFGDPAEEGERNENRIVGSLDKEVKVGMAHQEELLEATNCRSLSDVVTDTSKTENNTTGLLSKIENVEPETQKATDEEPPCTNDSKQCKQVGLHASPQDIRNNKTSGEKKLDKWTEKKFDFLKRAEEGKAAEISRHEKEKKKIFERRLSFQRNGDSEAKILGDVKSSIQENDKSDEVKVKSNHSSSDVESIRHGIETGSAMASARPSPFDDNSQSSSPGSLDLSNLPTSEYRRNKFLDYSERKVITTNVQQIVTEMQNKNESQEENHVKVTYNGVHHLQTQSLPVSIEEVKKEKNIKQEYIDKNDYLPDKHSADELDNKFQSSLDASLTGTLKVKGETGSQNFEIENVLKKMSQINFHGPEIKAECFENESKYESFQKCKKQTQAGKKAKRDKKIQHEDDERADKLTVENISTSKPTIKFSIQKSHDLKISFKVLNNTKKYEKSPPNDEESVVKNDKSAGDSALESKNSTELITLKLKSIQRDGHPDRAQRLKRKLLQRNGNLIKKSKRRFKRKKSRSDSVKATSSKTKKSKYIQEEERDPLAEDADYKKEVLKKSNSDFYSETDDFQVHETVDSAKIKLTFKRHKGNFETEYKINNIIGGVEEKQFSEDLSKTSEFANLHQEGKKKCRKKSAKVKHERIGAVDGQESFSAEGEDTSKANSENGLDAEYKNHSNSLYGESAQSEEEKFVADDNLEPSEFLPEVQFTCSSPQTDFCGSSCEESLIESFEGSEVGPQKSIHSQEEPEECIFGSCESYLPTTHLSRYKSHEDLNDVSSCQVAPELDENACTNDDVTDSHSDNSNCCPTSRSLGHTPFQIKSPKEAMKNPQVPREEEEEEDKVTERYGEKIPGNNNTSEKLLKNKNSPKVERINAETNQEVQESLPDSEDLDLKEDNFDVELFERSVGGKELDSNNTSYKDPDFEELLWNRQKDQEEVTCDQSSIHGINLGHNYKESKISSESKPNKMSCNPFSSDEQRVEEDESKNINQEALHFENEVSEKANSCWKDYSHSLLDSVIGNSNATKNVVFDSTTTSPIVDNADEESHCFNSEQTLAMLAYSSNEIDSRSGGKERMTKSGNVNFSENNEVEKIDELVAETFENINDDSEVNGNVVWRTKEHELHRTTEVVEDTVQPSSELRECLALPEKHVRNNECPAYTPSNDSNSVITKDATSIHSITDPKETFLQIKMPMNNLNDKKLNVAEKQEKVKYFGIVENIKDLKEPKSITKNESEQKYPEKFNQINEFLVESRTPLEVLEKESFKTHDNNKSYKFRVLKNLDRVENVEKILKRLKERQCIPVESNIHFTEAYDYDKDLEPFQNKMSAKEHTNQTVQSNKAGNSSKFLENPIEEEACSLNVEASQLKTSEDVQNSKCSHAGVSVPTKNESKRGNSQIESKDCVTSKDLKPEDCDCEGTAYIPMESPSKAISETEICKPNSEEFLDEASLSTTTGHDVELAATGSLPYIEESTKKVQHLPFDNCSLACSEMQSLPEEKISVKSKDFKSEISSHSPENVGDDVQKDDLEEGEIVDDENSTENWFAECDVKEFAVVKKLSPLHEVIERRFTTKKTSETLRFFENVFEEGFIGKGFGGCAKENFPLKKQKSNCGEKSSMKDCWPSTTKVVNSLTSRDSEVFEEDSIGECSENWGKGGTPIENNKFTVKDIFSLEEINTSKRLETMNDSTLDSRNVSEERRKSSGDWTEEVPNEKNKFSIAEKQILSNSVNCIDVQTSTRQQTKEEKNIFRRELEQIESSQKAPRESICITPTDPEIGESKLSNLKRSTNFTQNKLCVNGNLSATEINRPSIVENQRELGDVANTLEMISEKILPDSETVKIFSLPSPCLEVDETNVSNCKDCRDFAEITKADIKENTNLGIINTCDHQMEAELGVLTTDSLTILNALDKESEGMNVPKKEKICDEFATDGNKENVLAEKEKLKVEEDPKPLLKMSDPKEREVINSLAENSLEVVHAVDSVEIFDEMSVLEVSRDRLVPEREKCVFEEKISSVCSSLVSTETDNGVARCSKTVPNVSTISVNISEKIHVKDFDDSITKDLFFENGNALVEEKHFSLNNVKSHVRDIASEAKKVLEVGSLEQPEILSPGSEFPAQKSEVKCGGELKESANVKEKDASKENKGFLWKVNDDGVCPTEVDVPKRIESSAKMNNIVVDSENLDIFNGNCEEMDLIIVNKQKKFLDEIVEILSEDSKKGNFENFPQEEQPKNSKPAVVETFSTEKVKRLPQYLGDKTKSVEDSTTNRRHSLQLESLGENQIDNDTDSQIMWPKEKVYRNSKQHSPNANSVHPLGSEIQTPTLNCPVEDIPLPPGSPPLENIFYFEEYFKKNKCSAEKKVINGVPVPTSNQTSRESKKLLSGADHQNLLKAESTYAEKNLNQKVASMSTETATKDSTDSKEQNLLSQTHLPVLKENCRSMFAGKTEDRSSLKEIHKKSDERVRKTAEDQNYSDNTLEIVDSLKVHHHLPIKANEQISFEKKEFEEENRLLSKRNNSRQVEENLQTPICLDEVEESNIEQQPIKETDLLQEDPNSSLFDSSDLKNEVKIGPEKEIDLVTSTCTSLESTILESDFKTEENEDSKIISTSAASSLQSISRLGVTQKNWKSVAKDDTQIEINLLSVAQPQFTLPDSKDHLSETSNIKPKTDHEAILSDNKEFTKENKKENVEESIGTKEPYESETEKQIEQVVLKMSSTPPDLSFSVNTTSEQTDVQKVKSKKKCNQIGTSVIWTCCNSSEEKKYTEEDKGKITEETEPKKANKIEVEVSMKSKSSKRMHTISSNCKVLEKQQATIKEEDDHVGSFVTQQLSVEDIDTDIALSSESKKNYKKNQILFPTTWKPLEKENSHMKVNEENPTRVTNTDSAVGKESDTDDEMYCNMKTKKLSKKMRTSSSPIGAEIKNENSEFTNEMKKGNLILVAKKKVAETVQSNDSDEEKELKNKTKTRYIKSRTSWTASAKTGYIKEPEKENLGEEIEINKSVEEREDDTKEVMEFNESDQTEIILSRNASESCTENNELEEEHLEEEKISPELVREAKEIEDEIKDGTEKTDEELVTTLGFGNTDFFREEFYECEDIPTSEDLPNGEEIEVEKVSDDKFRNMMQNCLDNAKKFLNVGNLKLFSCSVDDLLELDCCPTDDRQEEIGTTAGDPTNHISRDVLLTSCEDNNDLGLSEKYQPEELCVDFVPSFGSEGTSNLCPEILPVDNWPYLEEEVPLSPTKPKQDELDLIHETCMTKTSRCADGIMLSKGQNIIPAYMSNALFYLKNPSLNELRGRDKPKHSGIRRISLPGTDNSKRFRRKSVTGGSNGKKCSTIAKKRRNTIDTVAGNVLFQRKAFGSLLDFKNEILRLKSGYDQIESVWSNKSLEQILSFQKASKERIARRQEKHRNIFGSQCLDEGTEHHEEVYPLDDSSEIYSSKIAPSSQKSHSYYKSPTWQPKVMLLRISKNEMKKMCRSSFSKDSKKSQIRDRNEHCKRTQESFQHENECGGTKEVDAVPHKKQKTNYDGLTTHNSDDKSKKWKMHANIKEQGRKEEGVTIAPKKQKLSVDSSFCDDDELVLKIVSGEEEYESRKSMQKSKTASSNSSGEKLSIIESNMYEKKKESSADSTKFEVKDSKTQEKNMCDKSKNLLEITPNCSNDIKSIKNPRERHLNLSRIYAEGFRSDDDEFSSQEKGSCNKSSKVVAEITASTFSNEAILEKRTQENKTQEKGLCSKLTNAFLEGSKSLCKDAKLQKHSREKVQLLSRNENKEFAHKEIKNQEKDKHSKPSKSLLETMTLALSKNGGTGKEDVREDKNYDRESRRREKDIYRRFKQLLEKTPSQESTSEKNSQETDPRLSQNHTESRSTSLSFTISPTAPDVRKRKSRFRNLHPKKKSVPDPAKDASAQNKVPRQQTLVDAERILSEMFEDNDQPKEQVYDCQTKSTKNISDKRKDDEAVRKKSGSDSGRPDIPRRRVKSFSASVSPKQDDQLKYNGAFGYSRPRSSSTTSEKNETILGSEGEKGYFNSNSKIQEKRESRPCKHGKDVKRESSKHRERRRDKHETKERDYKRKERHRESDSRKSVSKHDNLESEENRFEPQKRSHSKCKDTKDEVPRREEKSESREGSSENVCWICEVCGFSDASQRIPHIKSHPFHCQSCHLAFKTESFFIKHLTKKHKDIRNQHHCLLCELSFDTEEQYHRHLETREHMHLESVEKNTINTLFTLLTGQPCPVLGVVEMKPEWLPNQAGTVHFYHQATPLSLALQYLKMHHDNSSYSTVSSAHPT